MQEACKRFPAARFACDTDFSGISGGLQKQMEYVTPDDDDDEYYRRDPNYNRGERFRFRSFAKQEDRNRCATASDASNVPACDLGSPAVCALYEYFGSVAATMAYAKKCDTARYGLATNKKWSEKDANYFVFSFMDAIFTGSLGRDSNGHTITSEEFCASECLEPTLGARQALLKALPKGCGLDTHVDPFVAISAVCAKNTNTGGKTCREYIMGNWDQEKEDWCA